MTEQSLFDYETAKFEFDNATEELREILAKINAPKSLDLQKVATKTQYSGEIYTSLIVKKDKIIIEHDRAHKELIRVKANVERAFSVLDGLERKYCYMRYILSMSNKEIASHYKAPLEKILSVRKTVLEKIRDIECL